MKLEPWQVICLAEQATGKSMPLGLTKQSCP